MITEERLRNTRLWAAARLGELSGAEVIVGAIDELLSRRADETPAPISNVTEVMAGYLATLDDIEETEWSGTERGLTEATLTRFVSWQSAQKPHVIDNVTEVYVFASSGYVNTAKVGEANTTQTRKTAEVTLAVGQRMVVERGDGVMKLEVLPTGERS